MFCFLELGWISDPSLRRFISVAKALFWAYWKSMFSVAVTSSGCKIYSLKLYSVFLETFLNALLWLLVVEFFHFMFYDGTKSLHHAKLLTDFFQLLCRPRTFIVCFSSSSLEPGTNSRFVWSICLTSSLSRVWSASVNVLPTLTNWALGSVSHLGHWKIVQNPQIL